MGVENKPKHAGPSLFKGILTEKLLQYIWQFQYFNQSDLQTTRGEEIEVITPGKWNHNQGPDFSDAQIKIDGVTLAGSVELHLKTSQWEAHGHQHDRNYSNVVLHVVLEHDLDTDSSLPVLELESRIPRMLMERYELLMQSSSFIACAGNISSVIELTWTSWKERLLAERLTRKADAIFDFLEQNHMHWEETLWWMLARNFGTRINSEAFEAVARSLPMTILSRHKERIQQLEALLLGQAGLLENRFKEDYPRLLYREYNFLKKKYGLQPIHQPVHYLRMRPGNFPTVRLAQLAALLQNIPSLFSIVLETQKLGALRNLLSVTANDYWHYHYLLDEASGFKKKTLGKDMVDNVIINTIIPVLFAYGLYHQEQKFKDRAIGWLEHLPAENNSISNGFVQLKLSNESAFDSQAFIELKTRYCDARRCLECAVGNSLLRSS